MNNLKNMQSSILKNVDLVQDRTARILQEQERDLVRAFRARLFDVQTELEKEKSKKYVQTTPGNKQSYSMVNKTRPLT